MFPAQQQVTTDPPNKRLDIIDGNIKKLQMMMMSQTQQISTKQETHTHTHTAIQPDGQRDNLLQNGEEYIFEL